MKSNIIITDRKLIEAAIASIASRGKKLDNEIQIAALSVINHVNEHREVSLVNKLYLALSAGARKTAMTSWLLAYGMVAANTDADTKKERPFIFDKAKATNLEGAQVMPWYNHKPDPAPDQVFDVVKAVHALLAKAGKASSVKGADLLHMLASTVEAYDGAHPAPEEAGE